MSITRLSPELFKQAWTEYQRVCRQEGLLSLSSFCEDRGVPVQRLYEWLRRRNISVKEFQSRFSEMGNEESRAVAPFVPVSVGGHPEAHDKGFCAEGVLIEGPGGRLTVRVERMSLPAFSRLLDTINDQC